jgi:type IV fimbrial biogenesis protein FimT
MSTPSTSRKAKGFSLIELLITLAVAAVLLALALPTMTSTLERNRMATQANNFIAAVALARTEAIRRNATSGICASADQQTCGGTWQNGWLVWVDANRNNTADIGERLQVGAFNSQDEATSLVTAVQFNPRGRRSLPTSGQVFLDLQPESCAAATENVARRLVMNTTGGVTVTKPACS